MSMARACAVMPQVASRPISPSMWSPCMCVMKMREIWLMFRSLRRSWCCVPSPQSKSQTSARCGGLSATHETFRARVGTPALVPRKVIRKIQFPVFSFQKPCEATTSYFSLTADERAVFQPEAPGLERVFFGVGDSDARARRDVVRFDPRARVFNPDARAGQVFAVVAAFDGECLTELARPAGQFAFALKRPAPAHQLDALFGFDGAYEYSVRHARRACDDVELVVHAVDEVDVGRAARFIHRLGAPRPTPAVSVRGLISDAEVGFRLDDAARHAFARRRRNNQTLAEKLARDSQRVGARVETASEFEGASRVAASHFRHQTETTVRWIKSFRLQRRTSVTQTACGTRRTVGATLQARRASVRPPLRAARHARLRSRAEWSRAWSRESPARRLPLRLRAGPKAGVRSAPLCVPSAAGVSRRAARPCAQALRASPLLPRGLRTRRAFPS